MHAEIEGPTEAPAEDAADLVLLHGGIGTGRYHWARQVAGLARRFRVHLPDLPGHGRTPLPPDGRYDRGVLVDALRAYLERLGRPAHVAGFSMGGHTALALAEEDQEPFASLVLIGTSIRDHEGLRRWRRRFEPGVFADRYPLWATQLSRLHEPLGGPEAWLDVVRRDSGSDPDAGGLAVDVDLDALAGFAAPALLVRGDRDPAVDPCQTAELRAIWEQAEELVVPGGGHDVQITRHGLVAAALQDFYHRHVR
jgi:3-oxoadipate enol-lactonase